MYNRYIPKDASYEPIPEPSVSHAPEAREVRRETHRPPSSPKAAGPLDGITGKLGGLLKGIHLEKLDSGDILLVLILLFLFLESDDNLELVITLGLLLLFGLFGKEDAPKEPEG